MKTVDSKVLSYEEDLVEYESDEEFQNDCKSRKAEGWSLVCSTKKIKECYNTEVCTSPVKKLRYVKGGKVLVSYRWKRYEHLNIG